MRKRSLATTLTAALAAGSVLPSCYTDFRDAAVSGAMDAVTVTVSDSITAAIPLPDLIRAVLFGPPQDEGDA